MNTDVIEASIRIDAPPQAVYRVWADVAAWPRWDPDTRQAWLDGPFVAGARGRLRPRKGFSVRMKLVEAVLDQRFTVECPVLGNTLRFEHELIIVSGAVEVTHRVSFEGWLSRWLSRTVGADVRKGLPVTLQSLKKYVEQRWHQETKVPAG